MPFYEYQCEKCGHDVEVMQKVSDAPLKKCPSCGKSSLKRLMSAPVFRLKGSGWYETDFKSDQDNKRNLAEKPEPVAPKDDKKDAKSEVKKDDSKPDKAADATAKAAPAADKPAAKAAAEPARAASSGSKSRAGGASRTKAPVKAKSKAKAKAKRRR